MAKKKTSAKASAKVKANAKAQAKAKTKTKTKTKPKPKLIEADTIRARCLLVVDDAGKERAEIICWGKSLVVHLNDGKQVPRLTLQIDDDGTPSICLFTKNGAPGVSMCVHEERGNGIGVNDGRGYPTVSLGAAPDESLAGPDVPPRIFAIDDAGRRFWTPFDGVTRLPEKNDQSQ